MTVQEIKEAVELQALALNNLREAGKLSPEQYTEMAQQVMLWGNYYFYHQCLAPDITLH